MRASISAVIGFILGFTFGGVLFKRVSDEVPASALHIRGAINVEVGGKHDNAAPDLRGSSPRSASGPARTAADETRAEGPPPSRAEAREDKVGRRDAKKFEPPNATTPQARDAPTAANPPRAKTAQHSAPGGRDGPGRGGAAPGLVGGSPRSAGGFVWIVVDETCVEGPSLSCVEACEDKVGRCDAKKFEPLNANTSQVRDAFIAANVSCAKMVQHSVPGGWDGPWFRDGNCGYNSHPKWVPSCSKQTACGYRRLCPCVRDSIKGQAPGDMHVGATANIGSVLSCHFPHTTSVYNPGTMPFVAWSVLGRLPPKKMAAWGYAGDASRPDGTSNMYMASAVQAEFELMITIVHDLSQRLRTSYWLYGGALMGALRSGSLIPWDNDVDFCLGGAIRGDRIKNAYPSEEVELWHGTHGKFLKHVKEDWQDYMVAYDRTGSVVYVFSLRTGVKAEMAFGTYNCDRTDLALPVRSIALGAIIAHIPARPIELLQLSYSRYLSAPGAVLLPTSGRRVWTCSKCPPSARHAVCTGRSESNDSEASGARGHYSFLFVDSSKVRFLCRESRLQLEGCSRFSRKVAAEALY